MKEFLFFVRCKNNEIKGLRIEISVLIKLSIEINFEINGPNSGYSFDN